MPGFDVLINLLIKVLPLALFVSNGQGHQGAGWMKKEGE